MQSRFFQISQWILHIAFMNVNPTWLRINEPAPDEWKLLSVRCVVKIFIRKMNIISCCVISYFTLTSLLFFVFLLSNEIDEKQWIMFLFAYFATWYRTKVDYALSFGAYRAYREKWLRLLLSKKKLRKKTSQNATELPWRSFIVSFRQTKLING